MRPGNEAGMEAWDGGLGMRLCILPKIRLLLSATEACFFFSFTN